jgi:hypothetical protein
MHFNIKIDSFILKYTMSESEIKLFYDAFRGAWSYLYEMMLYEKSRQTALHILNSLLPSNLSEKIILEYTVNELNRVYFPKQDKYIEIYISPRNNIKNIELVNKFYDICKLDNINECGKYQFFKYSAFNINSDLFKQIDYSNSNNSNDAILYEHFMVQTVIGHDEKTPLLHIIINVSKDIINKILVKKNIVFPETKTSRLVWFPKDDLINIILYNIIGEYNLLNKIGYIEFISDEEAKGEFFSLEYLRTQIILMEKAQQEDICTICGRRPLQINNFINCSICKKNKYCSSICRKLDTQHSNFCNSD